jgi:hypothetical protein
MGRRGLYVSVVAFLLAAALATGFAFAAVTNLATDKTTYVQGDLVTITGTASAGSAVSIQVNGPGGSVVLLTSATANAQGQFSSSFRLAGDAAAGTYNVSATQGGTTLTASFSVVRDTIAPTLALLVSPAREFYFFEENLQIQVTSSEPLASISVTITATGGSPATVPVQLADTTVWSGSYFLTVDLPGTTIVSASGTDLAGNAGSAQVALQVGSPSALSITVDATSPLVPAQGGRIYTLVSWSNGSLASVTEWPIAHFHTPAGELVNLGTPTTVHPGLYFWDFPAQNTPGAYAVHIGPAVGGATVQGLSVITVTNQLATAADVTTIKSDVASVRGDIEAVRADVSSVRATVTSTGSDVTAIRTAVDAFRTDVAALRAELTPVAQSLGNVTTLIYVVIGLAVVVLALQLATLVRKLD